LLGVENPPVDQTLSNEDPFAGQQDGDKIDESAIRSDSLSPPTSPDGVDRRLSREWGTSRRIEKK